MHRTASNGGSGQFTPSHDDAAAQFVGSCRAGLFFQQRSVSLYAIISTGGKQYRVQEGDRLHIERIDGEVGEEVAFDQVLLIGDEGEIQPGTPVLKDARVTAKIVDQGKGDKVIVFKFKRRKMYRRKQGHRQLETQIRIESIAAEAGTKTPPKAKPAKEEKPPKAPAAKAAKEAGKATSTKEAASTKKKSAAGRTDAKKTSGAAAKKKPASAGGKKTPKKKSPKASSAKKPAKAAKKPSATKKKPSKE